MKLLSKYDLRERITNRPIEVFLAKELRSGLSRLVHVFEWTADLGEPTSQEILKQMCRWAPNPAGVILEAGRDETTSNVYLVTTLPADPFEVQAWVQAYEQSGKAAPSSVVVKPESVTQPQPPGIHDSGIHDSETASMPAFNPTVAEKTESRSATGDFTRAFRGLSPSPPAVPADRPSDRPPVEPVLPKMPARTEDRPSESPSIPFAEAVEESDTGVQPRPGSFTEEFYGLLGDRPIDRKSPPPKLASLDDGFPASFQDPAKKKKADIFSDMDLPPVPPEPVSPVQSGYEEPNPESKARTGEFTEFFRGVGAQRLASTNQVPPRVVESRPAEFDHSFRAEPCQPGKQTFGDDFFASPTPPKSTFTDNFRVPGPSPPVELDRGGKPPIPRFDSPGEFGGDGKSQDYTPRESLNPGLSRAPNFGQPASTSIPEPVWDGAAGTSDATRVFAAPGAGPTPGSYPQEEGPSEFTQIIQRGTQPPPPPAAGGKGPASGSVEIKLPGVQLPTPQAPKMPQVQMSPMQMPQVQMQPMQMPPMQVPPVSLPGGAAAPKINGPKAPAPPKGAGSYLPLIIALNVVLVLAIALVLYFVLKAH